MSWRSELALARDASLQERALFIEALAWLAVWRLAVAVLPFRRVAALLRLTEAEVGDTERPEPPLTDRGERVGWAVRAAAARTPWLSTCLVQSLTGFVMLRRHRETSTVYLGVAKDDTGHLIAHSWLRCGDAIVTGRAGHETFSVIAAYRGDASWS